MSTQRVHTLTHASMHPLSRPVAFPRMESSQRPTVFLEHIISPCTLRQSPIALTPLSKRTFLPTRRGAKRLMSCSMWLISSSLDDLQLRFSRRKHLMKKNLGATWTRCPRSRLWNVKLPVGMQRRTKSRVIVGSTGSCTIWTATISSFDITSEMIGKVVRRESGSVASDYMVVTRMSQMALRKMDITTTAVFSHARKQQTANGELLKRFSFDDWYWRSLI